MFRPRQREAAEVATADAGAPREAMISLVQEILDNFVGRGIRGVALCGVAQGDGVSFIAANLATALGRAGVSTLLVDANLRSPRQQDLFEMRASNAPGLADLLLQPSLDADAVIHADLAPGLSVLFAGEPSARAADMLSETVFADRVDGWLRTFEFTIIDTPPANLTPDALRIARLAGHALLVVRDGETFVADLNLFVDELRDQGVTVLGAVLNEG